MIWYTRPLRAVLESMVVFAVLMLGLWQLHEDLGARVLMQGYLFMCLGCAGLCAIRLRMPKPIRIIYVDVLIAVLLAIVFVGVGLINLVIFDHIDPAFIRFPAMGKLMILGICGTAFVILRVGAYFWVFWDKLRREHLIWSLTNAHIVAVVLVITLFGGISLAVALVQVTGFFKSTLVVSPSISTIAALIMTLLVWLSVLAVFAILATGMVILPSAIFSFIVTRTITSRLKALAQATHAVRAKDYTARVKVRGEDEIALLQSDFNAMTEELELAMNALRTERDTVTRLLETRRSLAASSSHELRTPLATIRASLEGAIEHQMPLSEHELETMYRDVLRLQELVDDLFALSRAEIGQLTLRCIPTDLGAVVQRVVDSTAPLAWRSSRVEVIAELAPNLPLAVIDAGRVEQILRNLLHNSLHHTASGGVITVSTSRDDQFTIIDVWDTGDGICVEDLPHIWEPFYRTAGAYKHDGAGLGLALVKQLTEAMYGTVAVESTPGSGSRFTLHFPRGSNNSLTATTSSYSATTA